MRHRAFQGFGPSVTRFAGGAVYALAAAIMLAVQALAAAHGAAHAADPDHADLAACFVCHAGARDAAPAGPEESTPRPAVSAEPLAFAIAPTAAVLATRRLAAGPRAPPSA